MPVEERKNGVRTKRIGCLLAAWMLCGALLGGCAQETEKRAEVAQEMKERIACTTTDLRTVYDDAVALDVSEAIRIETGGAYVLTGSGEQTVVVDAEEQIVCLLLDGVQIRSREGPGLEVRSAGKVILSRVAGTESIIQDSPYYPGEVEANAAIFSVCDLTVNGEGTLKVMGYHKDAIHTKDVFKLIGGKLELRAKRTGIRGNDGMLLTDGELLIEAEGNGLQTINAGERNKGLLDVENTAVNIVAGEYGMRSAADLFLEGNRIEVKGVYGDRLAAGAVVESER